MTRTLLAVALLALTSYGLIEAWPLLAGPTLTIELPRDNESFPGGIMQVRGQASRIALLTLDGEPVLHDERGVFSPTLTFPRGGSILTFVATDRFGRRITATRTIFVP
ncbi:MAG: hypothetical protein WCW36_01410 [Candidatus Paceibacterota bacterium]|jgi:hypothetical protein